MAAPTNTFSTSTAIGNREDLTNIIYRIAPTVTPFISMASQGKATNTIHEWQVQDLAAAASNAAAEGDAAGGGATVPVGTARTPTTRLQSRTQISTKTVIVSNTQQAMNPAGRKDEMAYQMSLAALELRRDMEFGLTQQRVGAASPRTVKGLPCWLGDNADSGAGYVAPVYTTIDGTTNTDGTQAAFTEARLKNTLQKCFTAGGDPDTILLPPLAKQTFSTFTGNTTRFDKSEDQKLYASIDVYVSDFGELKAVPSRFQRAREVFVLQADKWAVAYLRSFQAIDLAVVGDAQQKELVCEYAIEARSPKANGMVADIT